MTDSLAARIYACAHLVGEFRLRSGAYSTEYFDKYRFEADPALLREIAQRLAAMLPDEIDVIAGLELGGVPLATMLSQVASLPTTFVRKQAKPYGTCRLAEGADVADRRIVVVEDVITSGGQVLASCAELSALGADVVRVLCVIDREQGGHERIREAGLELESLFTMSTLKIACT
ncbi:MAG: orotate phosphoribosyltransferase [Egibacteraceae bacterium]